MFSIQEGEEDASAKEVEKMKQASATKARKKSGGGLLAAESIAEDPEGESEAGPAPEPEVAPAGEKKERRERRKSSKVATPSDANGGDDEAAPQNLHPARRRRERAIGILPNIEENNRTAKSLWSKGKMKLNAVRGFGGLSKLKAAAQAASSGQDASTPSASSSSSTGGDVGHPSSDGAPKMSMRKRESVVYGQGAEEGGGGVDLGGGRRRTSLMDFANATGLGGGEGSRRQSMMQAPGHLAGGGSRRVSMMGRRESSMMLPNQMGGKRESVMYGKRESVMMHRQSVFGVTGDMDPTSRMSKRQSSVFLQSEFQEEMRRREKEAKQHKAIKIMDEEEVKKHERAKAERLAQRDDVLTHNERVRRIIAKWKMREVQSMFLSWKRYTKKMSKARKAEKDIAPFLAVLAKESWERDEKDVDLLYSFVRKIKFFTELEENMSRDLCKMFKLEEYDEDEIVVRQGDEGDSFYIILYGSVSIWLEPKEELESGSEGEGSMGSGFTGESGEYSGEEEGEEDGEGGAASRSNSVSSASGESTSESSSSEDEAQAMEKLVARSKEIENRRPEAQQQQPEGEDEGEGEGEDDEGGSEDEEGGRILLCTRGPGDSFGELSLLKNQPRAATVQTDEPTFFVVIDKPDYDRTIKTRHQRKILDKVDFLCRLSIFQKSTISELAEFVCYLSEVDHPRNKIILAQGDDASNVHFVVRGTVQVIKSVAMKGKGQDQQFGHALLGVYGPGTFFGHNAILMKSDQPYSVVTVVETTTYVLSLHDFFLRLNSLTLQIIKESLHDNLTDEQTQTCITQHLTSSQHRKTLIKHTLPSKSPKVNSHTSAFRNYDIMRKKSSELNAKFQRKGNGRRGGKQEQKRKKIEDLLGDDEETEKIEDMTVKYGLAAASDALKDKTHDLAKFIAARTNFHNTERKKEAGKDEPSRPRKVTDLRIEELIDHNETFMDFTTDCALLVGKIIAEDENALIPHELMDSVFECCNKVARDFHLVFLRWSTNSFRLISEPIHTSREKLSSKEMLIKIADSALQINKCIEKYNDENYDQQEMMYENAAGIAYGSAFLRKNTKSKEICDIEGQVFDISAELCAESTFLGGVRCNEDIYEQLQLTHSLIMSGSEFVLDARLEVSVDQAAGYSHYSGLQDDPVEVTELSDQGGQAESNLGSRQRKQSNSLRLTNAASGASPGLGSRRSSKKSSKYNLLTAAISHSFKKTRSSLNVSIDEKARKNSFRLPSLVER